MVNLFILFHDMLDKIDYKFCFHIAVFLPQLVPVFEYLGASLFPRSSVKFFRDVFNSTMNLRRQDPDVIYVINIY